MSEITVTQRDREAKELANSVVDEVVARFANWKPTPAMLGFARLVAVAAILSLKDQAR